MPLAIWIVLLTAGLALVGWFFRAVLKKIHDLDAEVKAEALRLRDHIAEDARYQGILESMGPQLERIEDKLERVTQYLLEHND